MKRVLIAALLLVPSVAYGQARSTNDSGRITGTGAPYSNGTLALPATGVLRINNAYTVLRAAPLATDALSSLYLTDTPTSSGKLIGLDHYGAGTGGNGQSYAIDVHNQIGAKSALVIHQYSSLSAQPAAVIDNTGSTDALLLRNTDNQVINPGSFGTGKFINIHGYTGTPSAGTATQLGYLDKDLIFHGVAKGWGITKDAGFNATAFAIAQNSAGFGMELTVGAAGAGYYTIVSNGRDYGPKFVTATDWGESMTVEKNGTGAGTAITVMNKGTGMSLLFNTAATTDIAHVTAGGVAKFAGIELTAEDLTAGSCTANQIKIDTGGATKELCVCTATNNWDCIAFTSVNGPAD